MKCPICKEPIVKKSMLPAEAYSFMRDLGLNAFPGAFLSRKCCNYCVGAMRAGMTLECLRRESIRSRQSDAAAVDNQTDAEKAPPHLKKCVQPD